MFAIFHYGAISFARNPLSVSGIACSRTATCRFVDRRSISADNEEFTQVIRKSWRVAAILDVSRWFVLFACRGVFNYFNIGVDRGNV